MLPPSATFGKEVTPATTSATWGCVGLNGPSLSLDILLSSTCGCTLAVIPGKQAVLPMLQLLALPGHHLAWVGVVS